MFQMPTPPFQTSRRAMRKTACPHSKNTQVIAHDPPPLTRKEVKDINYLARKIEISNKLTLEKANKICEELKEYEQLDFNVIINSVGGNVSGMFDIIDRINNHQGEITAVILGEASSAAAVIALSCNNALIDPNSELMLHYCWTKDEVTPELGAVMNLFNKRMEGILLEKKSDDYTLNKLRNDLSEEKTYSAYELVERFKNVRMLNSNEKNQIMRCMN